MTEHSTHRMNEKSLANLSMPKERKNYGTMNNATPREKIDELFTYLANGLSITQAAAKADVTKETAMKYYHRGDPRRQIEPLVQRLSVLQQKTSETMNHLLDEQRANRLKLIRDLIEKAADNFLSGGTKFYDKDGKEIDVYDQYGKPITTFKKFSILDIERLMKLEAFISGGVKVEEQESLFLTADQIATSGSQETPQ